MPLAIVILYWNERKGFEIKGKYPQELDIQFDLLMQLYLQHEYTGEHGMVSLRHGTTNVTSYYTGTENKVYVAIFLTEEEDSDDFESNLMEITQIILTKSDSKVRSLIMFFLLFSND